MECLSSVLLLLPPSILPHNAVGGGRKSTPPRRLYTPMARYSPRQNLALEDAIEYIFNIFFGVDLWGGRGGRSSGPLGTIWFQLIWSTWWGGGGSPLCLNLGGGVAKGYKWAILGSKMVLPNMVHLPSLFWGAGCANNVLTGVTLNHATTLKARSESACTCLGRVSGSHIGTVRVFRQRLFLEDAIGSHACPLQAIMRVTNGIPLRSPLLLPLPP
jgi:hypothetical protein